MHGNYCGSQREQSGAVALIKDVNAPEVALLGSHKSLWGQKFKIHHSKWSRICCQVDEEVEEPVPLLFLQASVVWDGACLGFFFFFLHHKGPACVTWHGVTLCSSDGG